MDDNLSDLKMKIENLRNMDLSSENIPICSMCRSIPLYPVKNVVGNHIQTYCKECSIRWFVIERKNKDPNTGIFMFNSMKEDVIFNQLYERIIQMLYSKYFRITV